MGDEPALSRAQIETAARAGRLARMADQLVEDRDFGAVGVLLAHAGRDPVPLDELVATVRAIDRAVERTPEARSSRPASMRELRALRMLAASTLAHRLRRDPLTAGERDALVLAAETYLTASLPLEAAPLFERAGDDEKAADAYAASGEIEKLEACHARLQALRSDRQVTQKLRDKVESFLADGQRLAALSLLQAMPTARLENAGLRSRRSEIDRSLCRGRAITLDRQGEPGWHGRIAGAPAVLGRDPTAEIPVRDPGVSRRHATIVAAEGHLWVEDAGSRAGTLLGGAVLAGSVPLDGETELTLGSTCRLRVTALAPDLVALRGQAGLDRALRAWVGIATIDLALLAPEAGGLALSFEGPTPRLLRTTDRPVRVAGQRIGRTCDLMHGDVIEVESLTWAVE